MAARKGRGKGGDLGTTDDMILPPVASPGQRGMGKSFSESMLSPASLASTIKPGVRTPGGRQIPKVLAEGGGVMVSWHFGEGATCWA